MARLRLPSQDEMLRREIVMSFIWYLLRVQQTSHQDPRDPWAGVEIRRAAENLMKDALRLMGRTSAALEAELQKREIEKMDLK